MTYAETAVLQFRPPAPVEHRRSRAAIAGGVLAPERARGWLRDVAGSLGADAEKALMLLTCELVNNAVRHGGAGENELIELELESDGDAVRVEVSDSGPGFTPQLRADPLEEPGGWGLVLVGQMADSWGVRRDGRTRVWFELSLGS